VGEVVQMEQDGLSDEFKRKVAKWDAAGVFDRIAAKVDEVLEKQAAGVDAGAGRGKREK
jgi:hypothetical protein